jgi:hypothetical protein
MRVHPCGVLFRRGAEEPQLRVGPGGHGRQQSGHLRRRQVLGFVEDVQVTGEASAGAAGPGNEAEPLAGHQLDALLTVRFADVPHPSGQVRGALDELLEPQEAFLGGLVLVGGPHQQPLAEQEQPSQDASLDDGALAVLAGHPAGDLERRPSAVVPFAETVPQDVLLPRVETQTGRCGQFYGLVAGRGDVGRVVANPRLLSASPGAYG